MFYLSTTKIFVARRMSSALMASVLLKASGENENGALMLTIR